MGSGDAGATSALTGSAQVRHGGRMSEVRTWPKSLTLSRSQASASPSVPTVQPGGPGASSDAPAGQQSSELVGSGTPEDDEDRVAPLPEAPPVVPRIQPAAYTHSLKLNSEQTLCQSNILLCKPEELVGDIKDLAFIGNGSFAAVFKGESTKLAWTKPRWQLLPQYLMTQHCT
jgi:hypothetical protein